ncbi:MAG: hypothetical protein ACE15F_24270 [bacterium]
MCRPGWNFLLRTNRGERSEAHIFLGVLAYHLLHAIETTLRRQGECRLWSTFRKELRTHQVVTVILPGSHGDVYAVRRATRPEPHQQALYQKLNLEDFFRRHRFGKSKRVS